MEAKGFFQTTLLIKTRVVCEPNEPNIELYVPQLNF